MFKRPWLKTFANKALELAMRKDSILTDSFLSVTNNIFL